MINKDSIILAVTDELAQQIPTITAIDAINIAINVSDRIEELCKPAPIDRAKARDALEKLADKLEGADLGQLTGPELSNDDSEETGLRDLACEQAQPAPPEPSDQELTDMEALLLDRLAEHGPDAKVKSAALIDDLNLSAKEAALILREVMLKGYCEKVQLKPMALWRALKDSGGNPPVLSIQKEVPVTKCPPRYAAGYADLKIGS